MSAKMCVFRLTAPQKDIYYISWNLDACEGLGFLETVDAKAGRVDIHSPVSLADDVLSFIKGLRNEGVPVEINETEEI